MKKIITLTYFCCFIFCCFCPTLSGAPKRGFSVGVNTGIFPIVWYFDSSLGDNTMGKGRKAFLFGGEVGYQFTERIGIVGEFAYGRTTSSYEYEDLSGWSNTRKMTYTSIPIRTSLFFITPIDKRFSTYIGLGLGYYEIKFKRDWAWQDTWGSDSGTDTYKIKKLAPHVNFGIESTVSDRIKIFCGVRLIVGKGKLKERDVNYSLEQDIHFGGPEVKIGARFYL